LQKAVIPSLKLRSHSITARCCISLPSWFANAVTSNPRLEFDARRPGKRPSASIQGAGRLQVQKNMVYVEEEKAGLHSSLYRVATANAHHGEIEWCASSTIIGSIAADVPTHGMDIVHEPWPCLAALQRAVSARGDNSR